MKKGFISKQFVEYLKGGDCGDFENQPTNQRNVHDLVNKLQRFGAS